MKIEIVLDFSEQATPDLVEDALHSMFNMCRFAAMTNAEKTTMAFDSKKPQCTIAMDKPMRELLQLDVAKAQKIVAQGNPCNHDCVDEYICAHSCDALSKYEHAKRVLRHAHVYCNTQDCEQYANGTCPFGAQTHICPKYNFE